MLDELVCVRMSYKVGIKHVRVCAQNGEANEQRPGLKKERKRERARVRESQAILKWQV